MTFLTLLFGLLSGSLFSVLVGIVGSRRRIGFGWAFLISLLLTPVVGLIVTLASDPLPGEEQRWGCLGCGAAVLGVLFLGLFLLLLLGGAAAIAAI